ncbi:MAG TPA: type II secretion system protein [Candidatus Paceibacterota bacterium]
MKKGFTLLELLIVIGILAILATATVLVLNPAELLKQARDSQRVTDLSSLNSALALYVTSNAAPNMASTSATTNEKCKGGTAAYTCFSDRNGALLATCGGRYSSAATATSTSRVLNGQGWLPVEFTSLPGGSPLPQIPTDPSNTATLYYAYACKTDLTYVLTGAFESDKYKATGGPALVDGGSSTLVYEIGTTPGLNGPTSGM